jgi:hypothetical protein
VSLLKVYRQRQPYPSDIFCFISAAASASVSCSDRYRVQSGYRLQEACNTRTLVPTSRDNPEAHPFALRTAHHR